MTIGGEAYRDALRHFASGVTIVTVRAGEEVHGLTVSAFCSVSPEPPLVAVVIDHRHTAHPLLEAPDAVFAVNVLSQDQVELSNRFAWLKDEDRFAAGDWETAATGAPVLRSALANAENNQGLKPEGLRIKAAVTGAATSHKRFVPKARGSAGPILKRRCHISIVLSDL